MYFFVFQQLGQSKSEKRQYKHELWNVEYLLWNMAIIHSHSKFPLSIILKHNARLSSQRPKVLHIRCMFLYEQACMMCTAAKKNIITLKKGF